jgi:K+-transporting ATPase ATPase C chain
MKKALVMVLFFSFLTGVLYPVMVTGIAQLLWKEKANGSLLISEGKVVGSELLAQKFEKDHYFWPRPSSSSYNTRSSSASQLAPTSLVLQEKIFEYRKKFSSEAVGDEMVTTSGSGLDPHLSLTSVLAQIPRVAKERNLGPQEREMLLKIVNEVKLPKTMGFLGQERINVLMLNVKMDELL